jgi:type II secretory pathway pseudopilin PulG
MIRSGCHARRFQRGAACPAERGFTLVELLVYAALMVVVLALVGGMLISSTRTGKGVHNESESANTAQILTRSITHEIGNATAFRVSTPTSGTQLLVARTADGGSNLTWSCRGWYFDGSRVYTIRKSPASVIVAPTTSTLSTWSTIDGSVSKIGTSPVFTASGNSVRVAFRVGADAAGSTPVTIDTSATRPKTSPEVIAPCA